MAGTPAWQRPIPDAPDRSHLRLDRHGAHAVIDDQVVSTPDTMNSVALVVALGGEPPDWYPTLVAARTTLADADTVSDVPRNDVLRALRILTRPTPTRVQAAQANYDPSGNATWRRVALSLDPSVTVRRALATAHLPGPTGNLALGHLLDDTDAQVLRSLAGRRDALANPFLLPRLVEHHDPAVRRIMADRLPADSAWLGMLLADPDQGVVTTAQRVVDAAQAADRLARLIRMD